MPMNSSPSMLAMVVALSATVLLMAQPVTALGAATAPIPPSDFRLPAPTPTATPQVQGPVDIEGPVPVTPRVIPTERPAPTPTATPRPVPTVTQRPPQQQPAGDRTPDTRRFTPAARATPGSPLSGEDRRAGEISADSPRDPTPGPPILDSLPSATALPGPLPRTVNGEALPPSGGTGWFAGTTIWLALAAVLLALIVAAMMRSRRQTVIAGAPLIEPPLVRQTPDPQPTRTLDRPVPTASPSVKETNPGAAKPTRPITLAIAPEKLSRSLMNATLSCGIIVANNTGRELQNLQISGDLVTAHGKVPMADQLADDTTALAALTRIETISAGTKEQVTVNFNLPLAQVRAIAQGRASVYVPLLRLRVAGDGLDAITQTFVIGMKPPRSNGKVQPFRLDEMPQTYRQIGSRALD